METVYKEPVDFMASIQGFRIDGGEVTSDGMHMYLSDGRILVISGNFMVGVLTPETQGKLH